MNTSALQGFLRDLGGPLAAVGVPPKSLDDLRAVASALDPFRDLDLDQLADFLRRAGERRESGEVPAVAVRGLDDTTGVARKLGETVHALGTADDAVAKEHEARFGEGKQHFQQAVSTLAAEFGLGVKFTETKNWLAGIRSKGAVRRAAEAFRQLQPHITDPESYRSDEVVAGIDRLAAADAKVLTAAAGELGVAGTGKGAKFVESVLAKLTGIDGKPTKAPKKGKVEEPTATDEQVNSIVKDLQDLVARAKDPDAVPDAEVEAILGRVGSEFSAAQQKGIAQRVTGKGGKSPKEAIERLRADLTAVKRLMEGQRV